MKASDVKRAATLVEAYGDLGGIVNRLTSPVKEGYKRKFLEIMVNNGDDEGGYSGYDFLLRLDDDTAMKLVMPLRDLIKQELRAMGVELEGEVDGSNAQ